MIGGSQPLPEPLVVNDYYVIVAFKGVEVVVHQEAVSVHTDRHSRCWSCDHPLQEWH